MTAVLDRPPTAAPEPPPTPAGSSAPVPVRPRATMALAEAALVGVSLATIAGFARLFAGGAWFWPIATASVLAHLLAIAMRRAGIGPLVSTVAQLALLPVVLTWLRYGGTTSWLLPTERTVDQLADDLAAAWDIFLDISAPVPSAPGFVILAMAAAWLVAIVSDGLAFRLNASVEALAPATGVFLFSSILAEDRHRMLSTVAFLTSILLFALTARVARGDDASRWLATDAGRGSRSLLTVGVVLAVVAVASAALLAPRVPGADGQGVFDLDGDGGGGERVTLSPLVDIRSRLVEQSDVEVFRVEAAAPSYWRLTALDEFDGTIWSSSGSYVNADGRLPSTPADVSGAARLTQRFRIAALDQIWLPAAYEPVSVQSGATDIEWDAGSSTLVVDADQDTSDGAEYEVLSIVPRLFPEDLTGGIAGLDTEFLARFTTLPARTRPLAARYAAEAVGTATDPYDQALALQDWFRQGFRYSLETVPGHGTDALAAFLHPRGRVGYCEQFAGSYAALARSLGLPARVAVGFTPGETTPDDPRTYVVRGRNAHAWPEVYFGGVGWVAFEPTPTRGAPGAEGYTNIPPEQAQAGEAVTPTTALNPATTGTAPDAAPRLEDLVPDATAGATGDGGPGVVDLLLLALALFAGLWLVGVPTAGLVRRARRRRLARGHPELEVAGAWSDSVQAMALVDLVPHAAETPNEFSRRASRDVGTDRDAQQRLAELTTAAAYGGVATRSEAHQAREAATVVIDRARRLAGPWRRLRGALSPRHQLRDR